jgi:Tfp pilus assembly major pilin PilA
VIALAVLAMLAYAAVIVAIAIPAYQQYVQRAAGA